MAQKHILLVDDDELLRRSLAFGLQRASYRVSTAATAEDALSLAHHDVPDLVLLDIGLPGMDGLDALREFRRNQGLPVIFLTGRRREMDQVLGLELGADDYVTKPFDKDVLLARIKALFRRTQSEAAPGQTVSSLAIGSLEIDPSAHTVRLAGSVVELSPKEFEVLRTLAQEAGRVLSVDEILKRVWGAEFAGEPQVVYVHIRWLREKLEKDSHHPKRIVSVRGVGYKLDPEQF